MLVEEIKKMKNGERMNPKKILKRVKAEKKKIDWGKFPEPGIFLTRNEKMNKDLSRKGKVKKIALDKLGKKFGECYVLYRNAAEIELGRKKVFIITVKNEKYCVGGGSFCFANMFNPFLLFRYWHEMKDHFFDFTFPPLSFIASSYALETAYNNVSQIEFGNSYSSICCGLSKIKTILKKNNFDIPDDDRFVLQIKQTAEFIKSGRKMFVTENIKRMVDCLVEYENRKRS
jgi:hypothetical protein